MQREQAIFNPANWTPVFNQDTRYVRLYAGAPTLTRRTLATTQLVNSSNNTVIQFNTLDLVQNGTTGLTYNSGFFYNYSGTTRVFQVNYEVNFPANSSGYRLAWIAVGSLNNQRRFATSEVESNVNLESKCQGSATIVLADNDFFAVYCWQNSGSQLDIAAAGLGCAAGFATRMQAVLLQ